MPFAPHRRLTFAGVFGTVAVPYEAWAFRLNIAPVLDGQQSQTLQDVGPGILQAAQTAWSTHIAQLVRENARLTSIKVAEIDAQGHYVGDAVERSASVPGLNPFAGQMPAQVALAVTLRTGRRGASYRGRFYLPAPGTEVLVADGLMSSSLAQTFADGAGKFVGAINAIPNLGSVVIASSKGMNTTVTDVSVGRALDTIRSRRRDLNEAYVRAVTASQPAPSTN